MKPSPAQLRVLSNLYRGHEPFGHIVGQAAHGGAHGTLISLVKHRWVSWNSDTGNIRLTAHGKRAYEATQAKG